MSRIQQPLHTIKITKSMHQQYSLILCIYVERICQKYVAGFFDKLINTTSWCLLMHAGFLFVRMQPEYAWELKKRIILAIFVVATKSNEKEMDILKSKVVSRIDTFRMHLEEDVTQSFHLKNNLLKEVQHIETT